MVKYCLIQVLILLSIALCASAQGTVEVWLTTRDATSLLQKRENLILTKKSESLPTVVIDDSQQFQKIDGFGFSLTGGSAAVINQLPAGRRRLLLRELFGRTPRSISISYLRISIGASDLNAYPFTYNDLPAGERDAELKRFSLKADKKDLIPILKAILAISPGIKIMATPWTAPVWMKTKSSFVGGKLRPEFYPVYARYLVKYLRSMERIGIRIDAVTPQNEPLHDGNNPSMLMTPDEQAEFIKHHLGPAIRAARIRSKIIIYDHNCDRPEYPIAVLNDRQARQFIDGSAFHLYAGEIDCLSRVGEAHPDKNIYFTEQYTSSKGNFGDDLNWHLKNVLIGAARNWSKVVLEWNLASDGEFRPHTTGGCDVCQGALTIKRNSIRRNVSYYIIAHAAKFVPPGSVRIGSNIAGNVQNVAFRRPDGKIVVIAQNDSPEPIKFQLGADNSFALVTLAGGAVATFVWK
jgi:glucosylceramidase